MASQFFNNLRILPRDNLFLNRNVGSTGQIFYNKDTNSLQIYDGIITGGYELASEKNIIKLISNSGIATFKYSVTAGAAQGLDSGNKFYIDNAYKPALNFIRGYTYVFNQSDSTNLYYPNSVGGAINQHPLHFSANDADGELGSGTAYTENVIYLLDDIEVSRENYINRFRFATERKVIITITEATPNTLYYYCSSHIGMGNTITINDPGTGSGGSSEGASIEVSDTAPTSPSSGNLWLNTTNGILYVYQSGVWIQPSYDLPSVFTEITTSDSTTLTPTGFDTLNFREGTNIELVSDPDTNTITINVVGLSEGGGGVDLTAFSVGAEGTPSGNGELQYNNTTGVFTFVPPIIPAVLTDLGISDGTVGQVLTTDGAGGFTFEDAAGGASLGAFVFTGSNIDTNDSSSISLTPALSVQSDLTVENDLIVRNDVVLDGNLVTQGSGTPELLSDNEIIITAGTNIILNGITTLKQTTEIINTIINATGVVTHDFSTGAVFYHVSAAANFTANFTNLPTTNDRTISIALILSQGATPYLPTALQIDGAAQTIDWQGGSPPSGTANGIDVVSFVILRTDNAWAATLGSATSYS